MMRCFLKWKCSSQNSKSEQHKQKFRANLYLIKTNKLILTLQDTSRLLLIIWDPLIETQIKVQDVGCRMSTQQTALYLHLSLNETVSMEEQLPCAAVTQSAYIFWEHSGTAHSAASPL